MKQIIGDVRVYSRHSETCDHDPDYLKCDCPKWMQWAENGKTVRESAGTRSFAGLKVAAEKKTKELRGEITVVHRHKSIADAVTEWLKFRSDSGLNNDRSTLVSGRLVAWFKQEGVNSLRDISTSELMRFRSSLPYQSSDSSSLKIHWSLIAQFFSWAFAQKLIPENPNPDTRIFPQFKIKFHAPEVKPPKPQEVERVIACVDLVPFWSDAIKNRVRLFILTQRWTGMAITDTAILRRDQLGDDNRIRGNRCKTRKRFKVRIPVWLADQLRALPCSDPECFFWNKREFTNDRLSIRHYYNFKLEKVSELAKVKFTSHGFRHFFITEQLAKGWSVGDVSKMVGTSPQVIARVYEHWVKEDDERMDAKQSEQWLKQGLDAEGNKPMVQ